MNVRRLQGLALIVSAVCLLLGLLVSQAATFLLLISTILFILGIPAIHSSQPTGSLGLAGIILLELAALIALGFRFNMVPPSLGSTLSLTSALVGMLGAVLVGWLTTREKVFPAWLGWAFMAQGLLNFIAGVLNLGSSVGVLLAVLQAVVLFAFGYFIFQKPVNITMPAKEYKAPLG